MEICGARPVSTCTVHDFVLVHVIACLLFFYLFRLATRNGSSHCIGPKKKQATRLVCLCCFFVCSFVYLFDRLFVCVSCSFFKHTMARWRSWKLRLTQAACNVFASSVCAMFFICFVWPHAMAPTIASGQKKQATRLVCLCCFFVCSFVYLFDRLFVCVSRSFFLCFFFSFFAF